MKSGACDTPRRTQPRCVVSADHRGYRGHHGGTMKMPAFVVSALALTVGCASSSSTSSEPPPPTQCQKADRTGTYLLTWTEHVGGTCGPIAAQLVSFNAQTSGGAGGDAGTGKTSCTLHSDVWSEGDCKVERTVTCVTRVSDQSQPGGVVTADEVGVTRQETANASLIDGTISVSVDNPSGGCRSTYAVTYVRQ